MQEVIIYRNPMEAAFWNMARDGALLPVIVGVVVFFAVFLVLNRVLTQGRSYGEPVWKTYTALALGAAAGFGVMFKMASVL